MKTSQSKPTRKQLDLAELKAQGRKVLYTHEAADLLAVAKRHVDDLIEEGKIGAIDVGNGTRKCYRIPVGEFERFITARSSLAG
jgi:excisionase family DNA binding protein